MNEKDSFKGRELLAWASVQRKLQFTSWKVRIAAFGERGVRGKIILQKCLRAIKEGAMGGLFFNGPAVARTPSRC